MGTRGAQFIRAHAYSAKDVERILGEANREPGFHDHVEKPKRPTWIGGSAADVRADVEGYMTVPEKMTLKDGQRTERKRRKDARCLVAGVATWPETIKELKMVPNKAARAEKDALIGEWISDSMRYLQQKYGPSVIFCVHTDESHPHFHFFVVGDAPRLHPGCAAEFVDGKRLTDNKERMKRHKEALSKWGDEYQDHVARHYGMTRKGAKPEPAWRIKDRVVRLALVEMDKQIKALQARLEQDSRPELHAALGGIFNQRQDLINSSPKHRRNQPRF